MLCRAAPWQIEVVRGKGTTGGGWMDGWMDGYRFMKKQCYVRGNDENKTRDFMQCTERPKTAF